MGSAVTEAVERVAHYVDTGKRQAYTRLELNVKYSYQLRRILEPFGLDALDNDPKPSKPELIELVLEVFNTIDIIMYGDHADKAIEHGADLLEMMYWIAYDWRLFSGNASQKKTIEKDLQTMPRTWALIRGSPAVSEVRTCVQAVVADMMHHAGAPITVGEHEFRFRLVYIVGDKHWMQPLCGRVMSSSAKWPEILADWELAKLTNIPQRLGAQYPSFHELGTRALAGSFL